MNVIVFLNFSLVLKIFQDCTFNYYSTNYFNYFMYFINFEIFHLILHLILGLNSIFHAILIFLFQAFYAILNVNLNNFTHYFNFILNQVHYFQFFYIFIVDIIMKKNLQKFMIYLKLNSNLNYFFTHSVNNHYIFRNFEHF